MFSSPLLFTLMGSQALADKVAAAADLPLNLPEEEDYGGGEHKSRALIDVKGRCVFVLHSLNGDTQHSTNDKLIRLVFFIASLKDAGATEVTAVVPYFTYSRGDRRIDPRDPVATRYVADLFNAVGTDALITLNVHNSSAFDNAFRIPAYNLNTDDLFIDYFVKYFSEKKPADQSITVLAPDVGAIKRVQSFCDRLGSKLPLKLNTAYIVKRRYQGMVSGSDIQGDVHNTTVLVFDDMIFSGATILNAINDCRQHQAKEVLVAATHPLFQEPVKQLIEYNSDLIKKVVVSNTVTIPGNFLPFVGEQIDVVDCSELIAAVLR